MVMISAHSLLTIYLGLELLSLCLFAMVAMDGDSSSAPEAAMKYFVLGALASGMLLYGISMIYGASGSLEDSGCALRLRDYGDRYTLTYKGPKKTDLHMKVREEIETSVGSFDSMRSLLESIGLQVSFEYAKWRQKYRMSWQGSDVEVCVDKTPIGVFVEIEGARESIVQIAARMGWDSSDYITDNYVNLYREAAKDGG